MLVSLAAGGGCLAAIDRGLPLQAQSPGRFDVDLNLEGVGLYGVHVGERFLIPSVVRVLLGLIADRLAVDVALSGARLVHDYREHAGEQKRRHRGGDDQNGCVGSNVGPS